MNATHLIRGLVCSVALCCCIVAAGVSRVTAATPVYVNDDWTSTPLGADPDLGDGIPMSFGTNAFDTLTSGLIAVDPGGVVNIYNGQYNESDRYITKSMTLDGESKTGVIIYPTNLSPTPEQYGLIVQADDVTIRDLTIDGSGGVAGQRYLTLGLTNSGVIQNLHVQDVVIQHIINRGVQLSTYSEGHVFDHVRIDDVSGSGAPYGFLTWAKVTLNACEILNVPDWIGFRAIDAYSTITNSTITNCFVSIYTDSDSNYSGNTISQTSNAIWYGNNNYPTPMAPIAQGNVIYDIQYYAPWDLGLGFNCVSLGDDALIGGPNPADANTITADVDLSEAMYIQWSVGGPTIQGNTINCQRDASGIQVVVHQLAGNPLDTSPVLILKNVITATNTITTDYWRTSGILLTDNGDYGAGSDAHSFATIRGNVITGFDNGILIDRSADTPAGGRRVEATIGGLAPNDHNTITNCLKAIRIFDLDGPSNDYRAKADITDNYLSIESNDIGVEVDGGLAVVTGARICDNTTGVLVLNGGSLEIYDSVFYNNTGMAVKNQNPGLTPTVATTNVYWGSASGPAPGGSGDLISAGVAAAGYAYWAGFIGVPVSISGGKLLTPPSLPNDRFTKNAIDITGGVSQPTILNFFPPRDRHGVDNAVEFTFGPGALLLDDALLTIEYDPATDLPPGGQEKYMRMFYWNGAAWEMVPGAVVNETDNTVTKKVNFVGVYGVMYDDSIPPTGVDDWLRHE
ncbi:MAG: hypothetical protein Kow0059_18550 [Candidatus Sumerlaeia bacterium]